MPVIVALHRDAASGELHVSVHQFQVGIQVASVEGVKGSVSQLHVLVRNARSPCLRGHGFQRNALSEALELAH